MSLPTNRQPGGPIQSADINAIAAAVNEHTHPVTDLTATGTPSATTYLRGDGAWATPESGGGGGSSAAPLAVSVEAGNVLRVTQGYSDTDDLRITLGPMAPNNLPQITLTTLVPKDGGTTTNLQAPVSDWLGPWQVRAVNNANGDNPTSWHFTGGAHGYPNDNTGTATARLVSWAASVDGRPVTAGFTGSASVVEVRWTTNVQATNTKKADGSGREVLAEHYHLTIDATGWHVEQWAEFFEDLTVHRYYGPQVVNMVGMTGVLFHDGEPPVWHTLPAEVDSGTVTPAIQQVSLRKPPHRFELFMDPTYWAGTRKFLPSTEAGAFTAWGKTYMDTVRDTGFTAGETIGWRGGYRFWHDGSA